MATAMRNLLFSCILLFSYYPLCNALCTQSSSNLNDCGVFGNRTVLAIRVIAPDAETSYSSDEISNSIFGSFGKNFTMKSQFLDCSYSKFKPMEFNGQTNTGVDISKGVAEVTIATNVIDEELSVIEDEVLREAETKLGDLGSQFDFVMLFIPSGSTLAGTSDWKAYAFLNH